MEDAFSNDISFQMFSFSVPLGCAPLREAANITACVSFSRNMCIDVHNRASCSHAGQVRTPGRMWDVLLGLAQSSLQRELQELRGGHCQQALVWETFTELPPGTTHCPRHLGTPWGNRTGKVPVSVEFLAYWDAAENKQECKLAKFTH